jgi:hypothetical protein
MIKWAIYAAENFCYDYSEEEEMIATFDSSKAAEEYIRRSRLKRPTWRREFKYKSLLAGYRKPRVGIFVPILPPHAPKVDWK